MDRNPDAYPARVLCSFAVPWHQTDELSRMCEEQTHVSRLHMSDGEKLNGARDDQQKPFRRHTLGGRTDLKANKGG